MKPEKALRMIERLEDHPEEATLYVDQWAASLGRAVDKPDTGEALCGYGRLLTLAAILASLPSHQDLWTEQRIRRVLNLLVKAIPAAEGTVYYWNCIDRPRDFVDGLMAAYEGNQAALAMIERIAQENRLAIEDGVPVIAS